MLLTSLLLLLSMLAMSSVVSSTDFDTLFKGNFLYITQLFLFYGIFIAFAVKTPKIYMKYMSYRTPCISPLQSAMFTINKRFLIGLISSVITAAIGYTLKLIVFKYLHYDVLTSLDNWKISLSYYSFLAIFRFMLSECLINNTLMYEGGDSIPFSNIKSINSTNLNSTSNIPLDNSTNLNSTSTIQDSTSSSTISDNTNAESSVKLEDKITKVESNINYYKEQVIGANMEFKEILTSKAYYESKGMLQEWERKYQDSHSALKDSSTNLASEQRMLGILNKRLENQDYSISTKSTVSKRKFTE